MCAYRLVSPGVQPGSLVAVWMIVRAKLWRVVRVVWERGASACFVAASSGTSKYADKLLGDLGMDVRKSITLAVLTPTRPSHYLS